MRGCAMILRMQGSSNKVIWVGVLDRFGDLVRRAAIPVAIYATTNSAVAVGAAAATSFVPYLVMMGVSARFGRPAIARTTLIVCNLIRCVLAVAMAGLAWRGEFGWPFFALIFLLAACTAAVETAFGSAVRAVGQASGLERFNARLGFWQNGIAAVAGLPVGGFLGATQPELAFGLDALSYLAAAAITFTLSPFGAAETSTTNRAVRAATAWLATSPLHLGILAGVVLLNVGSGFVFGNMIVIAVERFGIPDQTYGFIPLTWSIAVTVVSLILARRTFDARTLLVAAPVLQVVGYGAMAVLSPVVALFATVVVIGVGSGMWNVASSARMQGDPPEHLVAGVLSLWKSISVSAAFFGALGGGLSIDVLGPHVTVFVAAALCVVAVIAVGGTTTRRTPTHNSADMQ